MAKDEIHLVKEEGSGWYGVFRFVFSVIFGFMGIFLVFKYVPNVEFIGVSIGFIVGLLVAQVVLWLLKMAFIIGIITIIGYIIFYLVTQVKIM
jgi:uncharacterized BrkB/YihY/UPF0761 family membrane protein